MTDHERPQQDSQREDEPTKAIWGRSLAAAAVCLGAGATIALIAILGQPGWGGEA